MAYLHATVVHVGIVYPSIACSVVDIKYYTYFHPNMQNTSLTTNQVSALLSGAAVSQPT